MNVLIASSEVVPFAKTGGLADVCGALPIELARLGVQPVVFMPAYPTIYQSGQPIEATALTIDVPIGNRIVSGRLLRSTLPHSDVPVYLVEHHDYFDRPELYRERGEDYRDNCERFVFFSRVVLEAIRRLGIPIDVVHCHDWQTGLIPAYLQIEYSHAAGYEHMASVLTLHNLAYQGHFWHWDMLLTGLDWKYFNWRQMEFYGGLNLLKTGLVFADAITTVSQHYAAEIQTAPMGCGLEGVLRQRRAALSGINNGIDAAVWNPAHDGHLPQTYTVATYREGKAACKADLQAELGLPVRADVPLLGLIGRLAAQKGWDLVADVMRRWVLERDMQWVILGKGEPQYHRLLAELGDAHPDKVAVRLECSDRLAHRIEAAADMFVMPSRYEPCGLNQLYSLKYGTVPVVRHTGGLADTIRDATPENMAAGMANGFSFINDTGPDLEATLARACHMFQHEPQQWQQLVTTGMQEDWSWRKSAEQYVALYRQTVAQKPTAATIG